MSLLLFNLWIDFLHNNNNATDLSCTTAPSPAPRRRSAAGEDVFGSREELDTPPPAPPPSSLSSGESTAQVCVGVSAGPRNQIKRHGECRCSCVESPCDIVSYRTPAAAVDQWRVRGRRRRGLWVTGERGGRGKPSRVSAGPPLSAGCGGWTGSGGSGSGSPSSSSAGSLRCVARTP